MDHVRFQPEASDLDPPPSTLIAAFAGWNDAGQAATAAVRFAIDTLDAQEVASIDPEEFYDFTSARPVVRIGPDEMRALEWPANRFFLHLKQERGFVFLLGDEPHLRWRAFTSAVLEVAARLNCRRIVALGGLVGNAVHTRPVPVFGYALDPTLRPRFEARRIGGSRYEGPTGIVGALLDRCRRELIPAGSLWAAVPQYLGVTPNPKAALALLEALDSIVDIGLNFRELRTAAAEFEESVTKAVSGNQEALDLIRLLERQYDEAASADPGAPGRPSGDADLPPPAAIIEDLEEFLRRQRKGGQP